MLVNKELLCHLLKKSKFESHITFSSPSDGDERATFAIVQVRRSTTFAVVQVRRSTTFAVVQVSSCAGQKKYNICSCAGQKKYNICSCAGQFSSRLDT